MKKYMAVNPEVAEPCLLSLGRHSEYLTQELVIMSLADEDISEFVKSEMAKKLTDTPRVFGDLELGKPKVPQVDVF